VDAGAGSESGQSWPDWCYVLTVAAVSVVSIFDAKAQFSALVARAEAGEEIVISKHGRPAARLLPIEPVSQPRRPGVFAGQIWIAPDFDDFTEQDERDWYGE
jgi:prevent-host-death family protein